MAKNPSLHAVEEIVPPVEVGDRGAAAPKPAEFPPIQKPKGSHLSRFKSKKAEAMGGVSTLLTALPILKVGEVGDFMRVHPDEQSEYWTDPYCFLRVPVKGVKKASILHLIDEEVAERNLEPKDIIRQRLILAAKPFDIFFFVVAPVDNLDNSWNASALNIIELSKTKWTKPISRKMQGYDDYLAVPERKSGAFPEPNWPTATSMDTLIDVTFKGDLQIISDDNPGLARVVGSKPKMT